MKHAMKPNLHEVAWYTKKTGVRILGLERSSGPVVMPEGTEILHGDDAVIAVGNSEQLKMFTHLL